MVQSNTEPQDIQVDWGTMKHGKVDILVHWNVEEVTLNDQTHFQYDEVRINWILPTPMTSKAEIQEYFDANYASGENILGWAQASKISAIGT